MFEKKCFGVITLFFMKRKKRFYLTLIELMVVIVLIGMISSVIAYNVQGSITKGKEMKTQQAAERLKEVIALEMSQGKTFEKFMKNKKGFLEKSGLVKKADALLCDGWGEAFKVREENGEIIVTSIHLGEDGKVKK
ncbi:MAG: hypothetical protein K940chlam8_01015 [Chlamydiae bacterium]|nr:hypothetical protein [Chlamydiota bacterium]